MQWAERLELRGDFSQRRRHVHEDGTEEEKDPPPTALSPGARAFIRRMQEQVCPPAPNTNTTAPNKRDPSVPAAAPMAEMLPGLLGSASLCPRVRRPGAGSPPGAA